MSRRYDKGHLDLTQQTESTVQKWKEQAGCTNSETEGH